MKRSIEHAPSEGSRIIVTEKGELIYHYGTEWWTCSLSKPERKAIEKILTLGENYYCEKENFKVVILNGMKKPIKEKTIRSISRKLSKRDFPINVVISQDMDDTSEKALTFWLRASHPYLRQFGESTRRFFAD